MTIEIINGCLLDAFDRGDVDVIGHCCNMQNNFGAGIAKSIKERYPVAYSADTQWYKSLTRRSYSIGIVPKSESGLRLMAIFNLYGQEYYGYFGEFYKQHKRQLDYDRFEICLKEMSQQVPVEHIVGFPYKMGCDRAGGDWKIVLPMIEEYFKDHQVKIYKL